MSEIKESDNPIKPIEFHKLEKIRKYGFTEATDIGFLVKLVDRLTSELINKLTSGWTPIEKAHKDGRLLILLICQETETFSTGFDDETLTRTIGFNNFDNDGVDRWIFPGWSWEHDCIIEQGKGVPVGYQLMPIG